MKIKDIYEGQKKIFLNVEVVKLGDVRVIPSTESQVCNVIVRDETGEVELAVFDNQIPKLKEGHRVVIENAFCKGTYNDLKKLTLGKFGQIKMIEKHEPLS